MAPRVDGPTIRSPKTIGIVVRSLVASGPARVLNVAKRVICLRTAQMQRMALREAGPANRNPRATGEGARREAGQTIRSPKVIGIVVRSLLASGPARVGSV